MEMGWRSIPAPNLMHALLDPPHTCNRNWCWPAHHNHCFGKSKTPLRCTNKVRSSGTSPFTCQMGKLEAQAHGKETRGWHPGLGLSGPCPSHSTNSPDLALLKNLALSCMLHRAKKARNLRNVRSQLAENHLSPRIR